MVLETQIRGRVPRLNPFAFPSDTDLRFLLLIVIVLGASVFIYEGIYFSLYSSNWLVSYQRCQNLSQALYPDDKYALNAALDMCMGPVYRDTAAWQIGGIALVLAVAGLIYWNLPAWKIKRNGFVPLCSEDAPEVVASLLALCLEMGLSKPPILLLNPLDSTSGGIAFGRFGRYYLAITGGLVVKFSTNRPVFRAVVLHELSHLRNADVNKTYFAFAISWAFVVAALIPYSITLFYQPLVWIFIISFYVLIFAALVYLALKAILRSREHYADVRASLLDGPDGGLGSLLESLQDTEKGKWWHVLQFHPDPKERCLVLGDNVRLFRMSFWVALGTGIAAAIAFGNVKGLFSSLLAGTQFITFARTGAAFIFVPFAAGIVGLGVWRETLASLVQNKKSISTGRLGFGLGLGILIGQALSLQFVLNALKPVFGIEFSDFPLFSPIMAFAFYIIWSILFLFSLVLFVEWIESGASTWLEVAVTYRSPRIFYIVGLAIAGVLLTFWLDFIFLINDIKELIPIISMNFFGILGDIMILSTNPFTLLFLISLWAYPLSAWFWRGRVAASSGTTWVFLEPFSHELTQTRLSKLNPVKAMNFGLAGGLIFWVILLAIKIWWLLGISVESQNEYYFYFYFGPITLAVLMQAGIAVIVSRKVKRLGSIHGLFAAFVAGCVMTAGILVLNLLFGGTITLRFTWNTFAQVVNEGAILVSILFSISFLIGSIRRASLGRRTTIPDADHVDRV